jgi:glycosyltransferase involved in cell wall biosynthesis
LNNDLEAMNLPVSTSSGKTIGILHGYHLDGSGSGVYVRNIAAEFCRMGVDVVLLCQEPEPERYDFLGEAYAYPETGEPETLFKRETRYRGKGIYIRSCLADGLLPVYVDGKFRGFENVKTFPRMTDQELQNYIQGNVATLKEVVRRFSIETLFANHIIMMPYIAHLAKKELKHLRYFLIPHGSEIEYTIKKDDRYVALAEEALADSNGIISGSREMTSRMTRLFDNSRRFQKKIHQISVGVDVDFFSSPLKMTPESRWKALNEEASRQQESEPGDIPSPNAVFPAELSRIDLSRGRTIVYFGSLILGKGVQDLVVFAPLLLREVPDLKIVISGSGKHKPFFQEMIRLLQAGEERKFFAAIDRIDPNTREKSADPFRFLHGFFNSVPRSEYFSMCSSFPWSRRVVFPGYLKHPALRYLLCLSDLAAFPAIVKEAYPLALLEALSAGVFPIVSDSAGLQEGIDRLGGLFPKQVMRLMRVPMEEKTRIQVMKDHFLKALEIHDTGMREQMVQYIRENYSWNRVCERLLKVFAIRA